MARPSLFTPEVAEAICERLASGEALSKICADESMPSRPTVYRWMGENAAFKDMYARAREDQADTLADEILEIADEVGDPQLQRLRVDTRKWVASKLKPKRYGDRIDHEHGGSIIVKVDASDAGL